MLKQYSDAPNKTNNAVRSFDKVSGFTKPVLLPFSTNMKSVWGSNLTTTNIRNSEKNYFVDDSEVTRIQRAMMRILEIILFADPI